MKTPILGASYVARSVNAADNRMVNLFPEIIPDGGKETAWLQRAPGLTLLATLPQGPIRGMWTFNGLAYVVAGQKLYQINPNWTYVERGMVGNTGPVSMSDNGTQLFIACNGPSYIYNAATLNFAQIVDVDFAGAVSVGYIDGYFVYNQPNSQKIWVTALLDGTSIDPLDFASAEGSPDNLVSLIVDHKEIWLFGQNSVEVWYDAGLPNFPLAPIQGAFNEIGCIAPYSVAKLDNGVFWLGADARGRGIVYRSEGYTGKRISTHAIEWQLQLYDNMADAVGYTYQQDGHSFYVLNFPSANTTWVYDVSTEAWHERASWREIAFDRHRGNCQMSYNNKIVIGDYQNGNLYAFDLDNYSDNGGVQKWLRSWRALPTGQNNLTRTTQHSLQLDCESGVGLNGLVSNETTVNFLLGRDEEIIYDRAGNPIEFSSTTLATQGADPQVMLRWSDDGGHTWSNESWRSMGKIGQYGRRVIWRRLGMTLKIRDRVYEVSGTDPVKIAIMGAELHVSPTNA